MILPRHSIMTNWSLLTLANITQTGLGFLTLVRLARVLEAGEFGRYMLAITVVGILQVLSVLSIRNIAIREISRRREALVPIAQRSAMLIGAATAFGAVLLSGYFFTDTTLRDGMLAAAAVVLLIANSLWTYTETLAFALQEMQFSSMLTIIGSVLWMAFVFIAPASVLTVTLALAVFALLQLLRSVAYLFLEFQRGYFRRPETLIGTETVITAVQLLKQSLPILGSAALAIPVMQLPLLFLGWFSGVEQVGYYGVGSKLTQPIALVSTTLFHAIYPRLSGSYSKDPLLFRRQAETFFFLLAGASFVFALIFGLFSREIVLLLFGAGYEQVIGPFSAQVWMVSIWVLNNFFGSLLMASDNERSLFVISVWNSLVIGAASFIGARSGADGLAAASLISCIATFIGFRAYLLHSVPGLLEGSRVVSVIILLVGASIVTVAVSLSGIGVRLIVFIAAIAGGVLLQRRWLPDPVAVLRARVKEV